MNSKKGFVIPIIIAIVAIFAIGGGYYYTQKSDFLKDDKKENVVTDNSKITSTTDETKDWKTYTNTAFGFEIKYPTDWILDEKENSLIKNGYVLKIIIMDGMDVPITKGEGVLEEKEITGFNIFDINGNKALMFKWPQNVEGGLIYESQIIFPQLYNDLNHIYSWSYSDRLEQNGVYYSFSFYPPKEIKNKDYDNDIFTEILKILSTFKFTSTPTTSCKSEIDGQPVVTFLSTSSGPIGTILEINGCNLSGFEGDLDVIFERSDGQKIMLSDGFSSYVKTGDKLIKVKVKEPCQKGEKIIGRYSGIESVCNYVELTPGPYKVYVEPWGKKSNTVDFNITSSSIDNITTNQNVDYGLIKEVKGLYLMGTKYIDDGLIESGIYSGYHRIVVLQIVGEASYNIDYLFFITKDYKEFYFNSDLGSFDNVIFDSTKVIGKVSNVPLNHPSKITLGNFVLVRQNSYFAESFDGLTIRDESLELNVDVPRLHFYPHQLSSEDLGYKYISGNTSFKVVDQFGLTFNYLLISKESYDRKQSYNAFYIETDFNDNFLSYKSYDLPLPGGCGRVSSFGYVLKNISINDLKPIGKTINGEQLYTLVDINSDLNKAQYFEKITAVYEDRTIGDAEKLNDNTPKPTYDEYVAKNPIIIFKDPWGRFVAVGEFQYILRGGCGKPVIYIYPEVPTKVKIILEKPTRFDIDIPTYKNGWYILANPDGVIKDLQPQYTNCSKINSKNFGSEYAEDACKNNSYPYLYWAGQVENIYPQVNTGWVVARSELSSFIDEKLTIIGLNEKERTDMIGYWVTKLNEKKAPYYRISFLQTTDMNKFAPMIINPKPDTLIRVFLDWSPLNDNNVSIKPEVLNSVSRQGYTVVEWGGLKVH